MKDEYRKILTEFLGKCWHEQGNKSRFNPWNQTQTFICAKCDACINRRPFDSWQDLGDLKRKLEGKKQWATFLKSAFESDLDADGNAIEDLDESARSDGEKFYNPDFIGWLLNPKSFCQLVADYLKMKP